ncbi:3'-5' exoribonuclease domain-containing protein [Bradyrhizobium lablabi]|uniref:3'-5' exoribonuclease Rv2179c-like domain-containing protein n=1 Tax=Bradyrhizobium lablabi TaxID=722472 RepID=A0A1H5JKD8_9BRAD|nr:3'-5' exoribonuclease [Bradyrhizobium lablabi]SEE51387.1 protein of unknown function [Bradyrhizobium lablabi]SEE52952.1 protein of unknown function [Bradyrhizobium lablabi]
MRYWFDTEFIEDGKTIDLLSIGIVAEDGRELYLENLSADVSRASDWVRENVIAHLDMVKHGVAHEEIGPKVLAFVGADKPEIWAYYADYDWVAMCQLFGTMMDLPKGWPMYCRDVKQLCDAVGNPKLPEQGTQEHNAIEDARWTRQAWEFLAPLAVHREATGALK